MSQGESAKPLVPVDIKGLTDFLEGTRGRVNEAELMERFVGNCESTEEAMNLYLRHFELYHTLYSLESEFSDRGLTLEIGLAYVRVHEMPPDDQCRYFDSGYCRRPAPDGYYCGVHRDLINRRNGSVGRVSMRGYYLDRRNAYNMDPTRLEEMMRGIYEYASNQRQIDTAYELLGVSRGCSLQRLRIRFRYLSKHHHPDAGGDVAYFTRLQDAYERLIRLHTLRNP